MWKQLLKVSVVDTFPSFEAKFLFLCDPLPDPIPRMQRVPNSNRGKSTYSNSGKSTSIGVILDVVDNTNTGNE